jgi:hypothetical protein
VPENAELKMREIKDEDGFGVFGIVTHVLKAF